MALLYGRAGRLTTLFGGFRPGQFALERPWFAVSRAKYADVRKYSTVEKGTAKRLVLTLEDGSEVGLASPDAFVGFTGDAAAPASILLNHNGLHAEIQLDPTDPVGQTHPAGMKDVVLESAITTIMDCGA